MKNAFIKLSIVLSFLISFAHQGNAKTRVAVSSFKDKTSKGRCNLDFWGGQQLSTGFRDQIATALLKNGKVSVVERENLKQMHSEEHELINADKSSQPRKNKFKAAHYSITGAVTQFEMCSGGLGGSLDVGRMFGIKNTGLKVGGKKTSAKVVIDMRVVDTETGEVLLSFEASGKSSKTGFNLDGDYKGAGFSTGAFKSSPIGKATKIAINKAVKKIVKKLPKRKDLPRELAQTTTAGNSKKLRRKRSHRSKRGIASSSNNSSEGTTPKGIKRSKSTLSHVCHISDDFRGGHQACKILSVSKTGTRIKVLNQYTGKTVNTESVKIFKLKKGVANPKIGKTYLVNSYDSGMHTYKESYSKLYKECLISDAFDGEYVFNCNGKEFNVTSNQLYTKVPVKIRKTASK